MRYLKQKRRGLSRGVSRFEFRFFLEVIARGAFQEGTELARTRWMAQLAQRFRLDLADAFARYRERLADFFERVLAAIIETKTHLDDFFFARRQRLQHRGRLLFQIEVDDRIGRRNDGLVFDEVAEMRIFLFADRSFE